MSVASDRDEVQVRRAGVDDWPQMWPIWHEVVAAADTYAYDPATGSEAARASWLEAPGRQTWVATVGGRVAGFYLIGPNHAGPGGHVANGSYMVDAHVRGRGIGAILVSHSLIQARWAGYRAIQFNAVAETNIGAIALYERLGFSTIGIVPEGFRHPRAGLVGLRIMYRDLSDQ